MEEFVIGPVTDRLSRFEALGYFWDGKFIPMPGVEVSTERCPECDCQDKDDK